MLSEAVAVRRARPRPLKTGAIRSRDADPASVALVRGGGSVYCVAMSIAFRRSPRSRLLPRSAAIGAIAWLVGGCVLMPSNDEPVAPPVVAAPTTPDAAAPRLEPLETRHFTAVAADQEL